MGLLDVALEHPLRVKFDNLIIYMLIHEACLVALRLHDASKPLMSISLVFLYKFLPHEKLIVECFDFQFVLLQLAFEPVCFLRGALLQLSDLGLKGIIIFRCSIFHVLNKLLLLLHISL